MRYALSALVMIESAMQRSWRVGRYSAVDWYWQNALAEAISAFLLFVVVSSCYKPQWGSGDGDALADVDSQ